MPDTRRKITVDLDFYEELSGLAKKEKRKLFPQLKVMLTAYREITPRQKDIERRVAWLEKAVK